MTAKARSCARAIAAHLNDSDLKCRMAALRALKCMGKCAAEFENSLLQWQHRWVGRKPEPVTTRALLFKNVPLAHLFKGRAPLGKSFAGPNKAMRNERKADF